MNDFNILIIEDESIIALRIKQSLENYGFNVVGIVNDSVKAIDFIQNQQVELILADITIDGYLNGIETVKLIQKSFDIPAVFLTAHQEDKFLAQAAEVNFSGYIVKPYLEETLLREVKLSHHRFLNNTKKDLFELDDNYSYDLKLQTLKKDGEDVQLSKNEKFILHMLIDNKNKMVSNEQIDALIWPDKPIDDVSRRQLLFRLRKKIPEFNIQTIKGEGYKLII